METLEVLGNNIANAPTSGYKADREFYRLFATAEARLDMGLGGRPWMPVVGGSVIDFGQGPLIQTEGPLDVALSGPGFLVVQSPNGDLYTRSGSLQRSATGVLSTFDGYPVVGGRGEQIRLPAAGGNRYPARRHDIGWWRDRRTAPNGGVSRTSPAVQGRAQLFCGARGGASPTRFSNDDEAGIHRGIECRTHERSRELDHGDAPLRNDAASRLPGRRPNGRPCRRGTGKNVVKGTAYPQPVKETRETETNQQSNGAQSNGATEQRFNGATAQPLNGSTDQRLNG